ncbi:papain-like cysteine protease family protein [Paraburkholderia sp. XV]|uniref:papain-like cysteine protease family protein n=1 Tax=Paraburkholderia sp. XV TaxID=2831520 RepID=UPI001CD2C875|nr:papain-like cysteine protease family protein [Paraburkholderia sp. XV]
MPLPFQVEGTIEVLAQPSSLTCWATAYTMMKSWKDQASYDIPTALGQVGQQYVDLFNANKALPADQFGPFLSNARLSHLAPVNLSVDGWLHQLQSHGLTWVGTMNSVNPGAGLHSRIVQGMSGDGSAAGTNMLMIDPAGGQTYEEALTVFIQKYETAYKNSGDDQYIQIRFFG